MPREMISLNEIARNHGRSHKAGVHKIAKRLGIRIEQLKADGTRGQRASHISVQDYRAHRQHFDAAPADSIHADSQELPEAVFYVVLLEPSFDPGRFKVGFSTDVADRLRSHRTVAPFSELVRTWPCKPLWEKTAIDCIAEGCERLAPEVFRAKDIQDVIRRAERFFKLMPASQSP